MEINPALGLRQVQHKPAPDPRLALIPAKCASQKSWLRPSLNLPQSPSMGSVVTLLGTRHRPYVTPGNVRKPTLAN